MSAGSQSTDSLVGSILAGAYRIGSVLAEGGMATVYEAVHLRLNKRVAVKVVARELAGDHEALARFRREAEVTSAIGHPHIVQVFDVGTTPTGEPFLVMEHLQGEDLEHRLGRVGQLSSTTTLRIVKQVASALAAAHTLGIVHRDLKPANIYLLDAEGEPDFVKVLDFGVSKVRATKLTRASKVIGTPGYMSREQAQGLVDEIDERTDQWALACIAWESLSGQATFVGHDDLSLLYQVVYENPSPLLPNATGLGSEVEQVLRRALSKDKAQRFASVADFSLALESAILRESPRKRTLRLHATPAGNTSRRETSLRLMLSAARRALTAAAPRPQATTVLDSLPPSRIALVSRRARTRWAGPAAAGAVALVLLGGFGLLAPVSISHPGSSRPLPSEPSEPPVPEPALSSPRPAAEIPQSIPESTAPTAASTTVELPVLATPQPVTKVEPTLRQRPPSPRTAVGKTAVSNRPIEHDKLGKRDKRDKKDKTDNTDENKLVRKL